MSLTADGIFQKIMEHAVDEAKPDSDPNQFQRFHVSQTADQLPDIRKRNAYYRSELEKQIQEKRDAERKRKEREALEEERLIRKIETDREKLKREYLEEIRQRELIVYLLKFYETQEETIRRQQAIAHKLQEIQEAEERKREEELRKRQIAAAKRIADLEEVMEKKRLEEIEKRKQQAAIERLYYWDPDARDYFRNGQWNSRDYVSSALGIGNIGMGSGGRERSYVSGSLDDVYFAAPLPVLADVYRRLVYEKSRIKDVIKERIRDGEG